MGLWEEIKEFFEDLNKKAKVLKGK